MQLRRAADRRMSARNQRPLGQIPRPRHRDDHHEDRKVSITPTLVIPPRLSLAKSVYQLDYTPTRAPYASQFREGSNRVICSFLCPGETRTTPGLRIATLEGQICPETQSPCLMARDIASI